MFSLGEILTKMFIIKGLKITRCKGLAPKYLKYEDFTRIGSRKEEKRPTRIGEK